MPEIAEVRVVAKTLKKQLIGKKIKKINILYPNIIDTDIDEFKKEIIDLEFNDIKTYGKWLIFDFGKKYLLSHLRMEGKYFYIAHEKELGKHDHVIFELDNGMDLRYNDTRKFGKMLFIDKCDFMKTKPIKKLGFEPDDERLTSDYLLNKLSKSNLPIKTCLLDQTIINGLGNIYANEVLYCARVNPFKKASLINEKEVQNIIKYSKEIIQESEKLGGCTIRSYTSSLGVIGHFQDQLKVHMKSGQECCRCKSTIKKDKTNGRSIYYCPNCQK